MENVEKKFIWLIVGEGGGTFLEVKEPYNEK